MKNQKVYTRYIIVNGKTLWKNNLSPKIIWVINWKYRHEIVRVEVEYQVIDDLIDLCSKNSL